MGLSKTGTTATAIALEHVGLRAAHDQGDQLGGACQAIVNTLEDAYECLGRAYPNASWLVTHTASTSAWVASVQSHLARSPYERRIGNTTYLSCRLFGCRAALPPTTSQDPRTSIRVDPLTHRVMLDDVPKLGALYESYYARLFSYLSRRGTAYALVDVRANRYDRVRTLIHPNITIPFPAKNTASNPLSLVHAGNQEGRCHNPRAFFKTRAHGSCGRGASDR